MTDQAKVLKDYYYILGVSPEASQEEISAAYKELYDKFGPHVSVKEQDPEAMLKASKEIEEAWDILGDPARRREYDQSALPHVQKSHLRQLWGKLTGAHEPDGLKARDDETRIVMEITLREAIKGVSKTVKIENASPCQNCQGKKPVDRAKCFSCHGSGVLRADIPEEITVPPGTVDKSELRLKGRGKYNSRTRTNADLVLELHIKPHPFFKISGRDLACTVPVNIYEAILGAEIEVPTATGRVVMKIQPLTQSGRVYRLKGMGIGGSDLLVTIEAVMPAQISADEVVLFRKLKEVSTLTNPRDEIFSKLQHYNQSSS